MINSSTNILSDLWPMTNDVPLHQNQKRGRRNPKRRAGGVDSLKQKWKAPLAPRGSSLVSEELPVCNRKWGGRRTGSEARRISFRSDSSVTRPTCSPASSHLLYFIIFYYTACNTFIYLFIIYMLYTIINHIIHV